MSAKTLLLSALAVAAFSAPVAAMAHDYTYGYGDREQSYSQRDHRDGDYRRAYRGASRGYGHYQAWGYQNHQRGYEGQNRDRGRYGYGYDR